MSTIAAYDAWICEANIPKGADPRIEYMEHVYSSIKDNEMVVLQPSSSELVVRPVPEGDYTKWRSIIGCKYFEIIPLLMQSGNALVLVMDEEGISKNLPVNSLSSALYQNYPLCGTVVVVRSSAMQ